MFDLEKIKSAINASIDFHSELGSTNDQAIELAKSNSIERPCLVLTEHQTAGRGQRGRTWFADRGSLTCSWMTEDLPLRDDNTVGIQRNLVSPAVALAVAMAIEKQTALEDIQLKWPNDLVIDNRKLCGILIESIAVESSNPAINPSALVVGIGINVNNSDIVLPESLSLGSGLAPTSIQLETGIATNQTDLLIEVVNRLRFELTNLSADSQGIIARYNHRLYRRGEKIQVTSSGGQNRTGICREMSRDGGLIIETINGTEVIFSGIIAAI